MSSAPQKKQRTSEWGEWGSSSGATSLMPAVFEPADSTALTTASLPVRVKSKERTNANDDDYRNWDKWSHTQRLHFLTPRQMGVEDDGYFRSLPKEVKYDLSEKRISKMEQSVEKAIIKVKDFYARLKREQDRDFEEESDYDDDDDPAYCASNTTVEWQGIPECDVVEFMKALPKNLIFTASFHATGSVDRENRLCHCPCSARYSSQWLKLTGKCQHHIEESKESIFSSCVKQKRCKDFALVAHLREFKDKDPFHQGILAYVQSLYTKHYGQFDHEALWENVPGKNELFEKIKRFKLQRYESRIESLQEKVRQWRVRHDKAIKKTEQQKKIIELNRVMFDNLRLKENDTTKTITEDEMRKFRDNYSEYIVMLRQANKIPEKVARGKSHAKGLDVPDIPQNFDISELFQQWYSKDMILFKDFSDNTKEASKLLIPATWRFAAYAKGCVDDDKGVDQGGLTRIFFSKVWDTIKNLSITTREGNTIELFYGSGQTVMPQQHDTLVFKIATALGINYNEFEGHDGAQAVLRQCQCYYRAFGRIMIHSLMTKHALPYFLMNNLIKVYLFAGKTPLDTNYLKIELYQHVKQCTDIHAAFQERDENPRYTINENFIDPYVQTLERIKEGLTLDGKINLALFLYNGSTQILEKLLFSAPTVNVEDVLKTFNFFVRTGEEDNKETKLNETQKKFKEQALPNVLKKCVKNDGIAFLNKFLIFVTGLPYINQSNPSIDIAFEGLCKDDPYAYPEAHTCEQELDFPLGAYDANEETLEDHLRFAITYGGVITMN